MRTLLLTTLILLTAASSFAAPLWVRNGAGTSEYYLIAAQNAAPSFLQICLIIPDCSNGIEKEIAELSASGAMQSKLKFKNDFNGDTSAVQTATKPGAEILINQSVLWTTSAGETNSYDMADATSLLLQAWGLQLRWSAERTTLVAERLAEIASSQSLKTYLSLGYLSKLALVKFDHDRSLVVLEDTSAGPDSISFTLPLGSTLNCADSTGANSALTNIQIHTSNWASYQRVGSQLLLGVFGSMSYTCDGRHFRADYKFSVGTKMGKDQLYHFDTKFIKVSQSKIEEI